MTRSVLGILTRHARLIILCACLVATAVFNSEFLSGGNIFNLLRQIGPVGIVAIGMAIVIIAGGIDLSVGAMAALAGVIVISVQPTLGSSAGIILALGAGALAGLANGILVTWLRINPFIGSLGTMMVLRGLSLTISNSQTLTGRDPAFAVLADYPVFGVPLAAVLLVVIFIMANHLLMETPVGRAIFAVGGNREASRSAGLNVDPILCLAYVLAAVTATVSGILTSSQINSGSPIIGDRIPLFAIAAVLIGGVSMHGGAGSLVGALQGVVILAVLQNGMNLYGISGHFQITAIGLLLIGTMMLDEYLVNNRKNQGTRLFGRPS